MMNKWISVLALIMISIGCSKPDETNVCIDDVCIDGDWTWIKSTGSIAGITITPTSEMQTRKLIIDEMHYTEYIDDELVFEKTYEFIKSGELSGFSTDSLILKLDEDNWYAVYFEGEQLVLSEPCFDCWTHTYIKQ